MRGSGKDRPWKKPTRNQNPRLFNPEEKSTRRGRPITQIEGRKKKRVVVILSSNEGSAENDC